MNIKTLKNMIKKAVGTNDALLTVQIDRDGIMYDVQLRLNMFDSNQNEYLIIDNFANQQEAEKYANKILDQCKKVRFKDCIIDYVDEIELLF